MKTQLPILFLLIFTIQFALGQEQFKSKTTTTIDEKTIIKDTSGSTIDLHKFMELMKTGKFSMKQVLDTEGNPAYLQLQKASEEEVERLAGLFNANASELLGTKAPQFEMTDLNGNRISSEITIGKVVVFNFWFIACKPCIEEIPDLNKVYTQYKNNEDVIFASITFDKKKDVASFLKKHSLNYPIVADAKKIIETYKIMSFPTNLVIDRSGKFHFFIRGGFNGIGEQISTEIQTALEK